MNKPFQFSIKPIEQCLYSRRCGNHGLRVFGYSIVLRIFWLQVF